MSRSKFRSAAPSGFPAAAKKKNKKKKKQNGAVQKPQTGPSKPASPAYEEKPVPRPASTPVSPLVGKIEQMCEEILEDLHSVGASPAGFRAIRFNNRLSRSLARTFQIDSHSAHPGSSKAEPVFFELELSKMFLNLRDETAWRDILAHEMLHTIPGCFNHQAEFGYWMEELNRTGKGYAIRSTFSSGDYDIDDSQRPEQKEPRYILECEGCGHQFFYYRMCDKVRYPDRLRCGACGSKVRRVL